MKNPFAINPPILIVAVGIAITSFIFILSSLSPAVVLLAIIPAIIVFTLSYWVGFRNPSTIGSRIWAFAIGAFVTVPISLAISFFVDPWLERIGISTYAAAGIIEEAVKGGAILWLARSWQLFDSVLRGLAYAILVAGGFAFTENILYFSQTTDYEGLIATFAVRGVILPFAHPIFTATFGIAAGWIAGCKMYGRSSSANSLILSISYALGAVGHGLWNLLSFFNSLWYIPAYIISLALLLLITMRAQRAETKRFEDSVLNAGSTLSEIERTMLLDRSLSKSLKSVQTPEENKALNIWINIWRRTGSGASLSAVINAAEPWRAQWYNNKPEINLDTI